MEYKKLIEKASSKARTAIMLLLCGTSAVSAESIQKQADNIFSNDDAKSTELFEGTPTIINFAPDDQDSPVRLGGESKQSNLETNKLLEGPTHNLDTALTVNSGDILAGFPGKLLGFNQTISNNNYQINNWNSQSGVPMDWLVTGNGDTVIYGGNSAGWPAFKKLDNANWTQIAVTIGKGVTDLVGIPNGPTTADINFFLMATTTDEILKKKGTTGAITTVASNLPGMNSMTSNGTDTIFVAYGTSGGIRAYNTSNFSQYTDLKYNLPDIQVTSIAWKNGNLIVTAGDKIFILKQGETQWTEVADMTGNQPMAVTWLQGQGSSELDFAVGCQLWTNNLFIYREAIAPAFSSATITPDHLLVNPGVTSDSATISCNVLSKPTEVHADLSSLGGSDSVALSQTALQTWAISGITFPNAAPGQHTIPIIATNSKGSTTTTINLTFTENEPPVWSNPVDTLFLEEGESDSLYILNSSDPNGHSITTSWNNLPAFLDGDGNELSGLPGNEDVGVHPISADLIDSMQDTTHVNFNYKITNRTPEFTSTPPLFANAGTPYSYTPTLLYNGIAPVTAVTLPPWATFSNGTLSGNPTYGTFPVILRCDDGNGGVVDQSFEIQVNDTNPLPDSLRGNTNHLVSSTDSVFTITLPKKYNKNFTYQAFNIGTAIKSVKFVDASDNLKVNVELKTGNQRTFRIRVFSGNQTQFESGELYLALHPNVLTLLSPAQNSRLNQKDTILTRALTGAATAWKVFNETNNHTEVWSFSRATIGVFEERTAINELWLNNADSLQTLKIVITNQSTGKSIERTIPVKKVLTSIKAENKELPKEFTLEQNYPNPFNPSTSISYQLPKAEYVTLKIYDILGNEVKTVVNEMKEAGEYTAEFSAAGGASSLASGTYVYRLQAGEFVQVRKMIMLK